MQETQLDLSIIVPVYNTAKFLNKCIESIVNQKLLHTEILIINDGSTDDSFLLAKELESQHPKLIKVFDKPNGGLSDARNYGLEKAVGKYISFIDSDDYVDEDMHKIMLTEALKNDIDVVFCDFEVVNEDYQHIMNWSASTCPDGVVEMKSDPSLLAKILPSACNKLFKRACFEANQARFDRGLWYEDSALVPFLIATGDRIQHLRLPLYKYVKREGSISKSYSDKVLDGLKATHLLEDRFRKAGLYTQFGLPLLTMKLNMISFTALRVFKAPSLISIYRDLQHVVSEMESVEGKWLDSKAFKGLNTVPKLVLLSLKFRWYMIMAIVYKVKIAVKDRGL